MNELFLGIVGGLASSALFLLALSRLRPLIKVSSHISVGEYDGKKYYSLKVLNSGRRAVNSIRAELYIIGYRAVKGGNGRGKKYFRVPLLQDSFVRLEPLATQDGESSSFEFSTTIDLPEEWKTHEESYLMLFVTSQDDLTSFSKTITAKYESPAETFKDGRFGFGKDMAVHA